MTLIKKTISMILAALLLVSGQAAFAEGSLDQCTRAWEAVADHIVLRFADEEIEIEPSVRVRAATNLTFTMGQVSIALVKDDEELAAIWMEETFANTGAISFSNSKGKYFFDQSDGRFSAMTSAHLLLMALLGFTTDKDAENYMMPAMLKNCQYLLSSEEDFRTFFRTFLVQTEDPERKILRRRLIPGILDAEFDVHVRSFDPEGSLFDMSSMENLRYSIKNGFQSAEEMTNAYDEILETLKKDNSIRKLLEHLDRQAEKAGTDQ